MLGKKIKGLFSNPAYAMIAFNIIAALGMAAPLSYLSAYLARIGVTNAQISTMSAVRTAATIVGLFLWGYVADKSKNINVILGMLLSGVVSSAVLFILFRNYIGIFIAGVVYSFFFSAVYALQDTICLNLVAKGAIKNYGRVRVMGSLGYIISVWFSGIMSEQNPVSVFYIMGGFTLASILVLALLPKTEGQRKKKEKFNTLKFFTQPTVIFFLIAYQLAHFIMATFGTQFSIYYSVDLGAGDGLLGLSLAIKVGGEFLVLPFIKKIQKLLKYKYAFALFCFLPTISYLVCALSQNMICLLLFPIFVQIGYIGGLTWLISYVGKLAPENGKATVQSHIWLISAIVTIFASISMRYFSVETGPFIYFIVLAGLSLIAGIIPLFSKTDTNAADF